MTDHLNMSPQDRAQLAALREALEAGAASGIAEGDVFARVRDTVGLTRSQ